MLVEIKNGETWMKVLTLKGGEYPNLKVIDDVCAGWFQCLQSNNGKIATFRIDGEEARCGITMEDSLFLESGSVAFYRVGLSKAVSIPDGTVIQSI